MRGLLAAHQTASGDNFVDYVCVAKTQRRRGVGAALLQHLQPPISLIVAPLSRAMRFYAAEGFAPSVSSPYTPTVGEMAMRAERLRVRDNIVPVLEYCAWTAIPPAEREAAVAIVREQGLSERAARRVLCVDDPIVRYLVAP